MQNFTSVEDILRYVLEMLNSGNFEEAALVTRQVLQQNPRSQQFLSICNQVLSQIPGEPNFAFVVGEASELQGDTEQAKIHYESILASQHNAPTQTRVALRAMARLAIMRGHNENHWLYIASAPKSASTFLSATLSKLSGYPLAQLAYAYEDNERDLYLPALIDYAAQGAVITLHSMPNTPNIRLLKEFKVRPMILTRNLFDTAVSIFDHLKRERELGSLVPPVSEAYLQMDDQQQLDYVIDFAMPWYFKFYAGWKKLVPLHSLEALWLSYEELTTDTANQIARIGDFYSLSFTQQAIQQASDEIKGSGKSRFNKGVSGRGRQRLNDAQVARLRKYADYFPDVDFSTLLHSE